MKGKHQFRFGGEFRQAQVDEFYQRHSVGTFVFNGSSGPWASDYGNCTGPFATGSLASALQANPLAAFFLWPISLAAIWPPRVLRAAMRNGRCSSRLSTCLRRTAGSSHQGLISTMVSATITCNRCRAISRTSRSFVRNLLTATACLPRQSNRLALPVGLDQLQPAPWILLFSCFHQCNRPPRRLRHVLRYPEREPVPGKPDKQQCAQWRRRNTGGPEPVYTVATYGTPVVPGQSIFPVVTPTTTSLCNPGSPCGVFSVNCKFKNAL